MNRIRHTFPKLQTVRKPAWSISDCTTVLRSLNPSLTRKRNIFSNHIGDWFDDTASPVEGLSASGLLRSVFSLSLSSLLTLVIKLCLNIICEVGVADDCEINNAGASDSRVKIIARPLRSRHLSGDSGHSVRPLLSCTAGSR